MGRLRTCTSLACAPPWFEYELSVSASVPAISTPYVVAIDVRGAYVSIECRGGLHSHSEVRLLQRDVHVVLRKSGRSIAVFDQRALEPFSQEVLDALWEWWTTSFTRCAIVVSSEMMSVQTNMMALVRNVRLRAFTSAVSAVNWALQV